MIKKFDSRNLKDYLLPTAAQAFWCLAIALALTLFVYHTPLLTRIANTQAVSVDLVSQSFTQRLASLNESVAVQTAVIVIFWALVGLCTFGVYAALRNNGSIALDELTIKREYTNRGSSKGRYNWAIIRIAAAIGAIIGLQLMWHVGLPFWFGLIEQIILGTATYASLPSFFIGFFGLSLSIYALWLLFYTAIIADRI